MGFPVYAFPVYEWRLVDEFVDRDVELDRLERWWSGAERMPVNLYGRRRVGKSWLFRRFAHGKPAMLLVAERLAEGTQLTRFAGQLGAYADGLTPDLPDVASLFRTLYRLAREETLLAVIDEFPWLLGSSQSAADETLSSIQAVMEEERDRSRLKLIVCGSAVAQMEALQAERNPLYGRLMPLEVRPLTFAGAEPFLVDLEPVDAFTRFAIAGGMPRYLAALGGGALADAVGEQMLRPDAPLWNEGRTIVGQELREPAVHFSVIEALASGEKELRDLSGALRMDGSRVSAYLAKLEDLRLVRRELPLGAPVTSRTGHWVLEDPFLRFWFRFVFPYQADLEAGLAAENLYRSEIEPVLAHHVAPIFEQACRAHVRSEFGRIATRVGRWWGNALDELRRSGRRSSEEIDIVGISRGRVTLVGEVKWANAPLDVSILHDLEAYKLPALRQAGYRTARNPKIVLSSRSGYTDGLMQRQHVDEHLTLVDVRDMLSTRERRAAS